MLLAVIVWFTLCLCSVCFRVSPVSRCNINRKVQVLEATVDPNPNEDIKPVSNPINMIPFGVIYGIIPAISITLVDPNLNFIASNPTSLIILLAVKRIHLYSMALVAIDFLSNQAVYSKPNILDRFIQINEKVLGTSFTLDATEAAEEIGLLSAVKETSDSTQATALPIVLAAALTATYITTSFFDAAPAISPSLNPPLLILFLHNLLPLLPVLPIAIVCLLFTRAQVANILPSSLNGAPLFLAASAVGSSIFGPTSIVWPLQNMINLAIAATVSTLVQFPKLGTVLLALGGLVIYDVVSVYGTSSIEAAGGASVMESVARSRIGDAASGGGRGIVHWLPGLLEEVSRGRVTDGLGLGDVIFPSMLTGWAKRYDSQSSDGSRLYEATLIGYFLGCALCEIYFSVSAQRGLPALLFIVPAMVSAVIISAKKLTEVQKMLNTFSEDEEDEKFID